MKAILYIRFSSAEQAQGDSERRQRALGQRWANSNGYTITSVIVDEGLSGYKGDHVRVGELGRFLNDVSEGKVERGTVLLVESLDRLSRERATTAVRRLLDLYDAGITVAETDGTDFGQLDSRKLAEALGKIQLANEESEKKSKRIKAAWEAKKAAASTEPISAHVPFGYQLVDRVWDGRRARGGRIELHPTNAPLVKELFQRIADGQSVKSCERFMNGSGVAPTYNKNTDPAPVWSAGTINKMLRSKSYTGDLWGKGALICAGYYPPIIDLKTWQAVQDILTPRAGKAKTHKHSTTNLLTGMSYCSVCGGQMAVIDKGKGNRFLVCSQARAAKHKGKFVPLQLLELSILDKLRDGQLDLWPTTDRKHERTASKELAAAQASLKKLEAKADVAADALMALGSAAPSNDRLRASLDRAEQAVAEAKQHVKDLKQAVTDHKVRHGAFDESLKTLRECPSFADLLDVADDDDRLTRPTPANLARMLNDHLFSNEDRVRIKHQLRQIVSRIDIDADAGTWSATLHSGAVIKSAFDAFFQVLLAIWERWAASIAAKANDPYAYKSVSDGIIASLK